MAFRVPFRARMRPATDSITSRHEYVRRRIPSASSHALCCHRSPAIAPSSGFSTSIVLPFAKRPSGSARGWYDRRHGGAIPASEAPLAPQARRARRPLMPAMPFHPTGVTYNGLHATTSPTPAQVAADLAATKPHFGHVRTYYPQYGGGAVDVGQLAKNAYLTLLLSLFLFEGHSDWTAENYAHFVKPAVARGNVAGLLIGNEDPHMLGAIVQYLGQARADFPNVP